jgi:type IV pilus assembly protein PilM
MPAALKLKLGRRAAGADLVGLDIQPGFIAAVQASVNGSILAQRAATLPLGAEVVREGDVVDVEALGKALQELFSGSGLGKHVRLGVANQRTVMRMLELPPLTDQKELAAAVRFQAQDQVPMPLNNAVLDFHSLGVYDTPAGPRQRVVLVAAQRDMVERLLAAVRRAGLRADGIDLSAFALIRSLYRRGEEDAGRVLYLNIDGLTNLAIAEGTMCRFTRVLAGGMEAMAVELAERRGIALADARALLAAADLTTPDAVELAAEAPVQALQAEEAEPLQAAEPALDVAEDDFAEHDFAMAAREDDFPDAELEHGGEDPELEQPDQFEHEHSDQAAVGNDPDAGEELGLPSGGDLDGRDEGLSYAEALAAPTPIPAPPSAPLTAADPDVRMVLENGIREISGEVRNSLEFHRTQEDGGTVSHVALSGFALDIPGFAEALQLSLGTEVHAETVDATDSRLAEQVSLHRLAVAAGLAAIEAPR